MSARVVADFEGTATTNTPNEQLDAENAMRLGYVARGHASVPERHIGDAFCGPTWWDIGAVRRYGVQAAETFGACPNIARLDPRERIAARATTVAIERPRGRMTAKADGAQSKTGSYHDNE